MSISLHYGQQTRVIMWRQGSCSWPRLHPTAPYARAVLPPQPQPRSTFLLTSQICYSLRYSQSVHHQTDLLTHLLIKTRFYLPLEIHSTGPCTADSASPFRQCSGLAQDLSRYSSQEAAAGMSSRIFPVISSSYPILSILSYPVPSTIANAIPSYHIHPLSCPVLFCSILSCTLSIILPTLFYP
jgi:hypothetical protein